MLFAPSMRILIASPNKSGLIILNSIDIIAKMPIKMNRSLYSFIK